VATIAVFNNDTNELTNLIVAELTDACPLNHRFELVPEGHYWNGTEFVKQRSIFIVPEVL
jgi:hypothetical protein